MRVAQTREAERHRFQRCVPADLALGVTYERATALRLQYLLSSALLPFPCLAMLADEASIRLHRLELIAIEASIKKAAMSEDGYTHARR